MRLVVTSESRFHSAADGSVWTKGPCDYRFWQRYLVAFDQVRIVARVHAGGQPDSSYRPVTGTGVELRPLPFYLGPRQFFLQRYKIRKTLMDALGHDDALLCRVCSPIATELLSQLERDRPYALEVIGDPHDALAPGTVRHPLRAVFRFLTTRSLHLQCARAAAVSYVTREALQRKYRPSSTAYSTHYSSLVCSPSDFVEQPRSFPAVPGRPEIIFVGSLAQMYKGPDVIIRAVKALASDLDFTLTMVGDGKHRPELEQLSHSLGVADRIRFLGEVPAGAAVRAHLDRATLMVMPSRTEGLPRAMIEAMVRGLPVIGTKVGGIPELLVEEDMVLPDDAEALAEKIRQVLRDPQRLAQMSQRNLVRAQDYRPEVLARRREGFYRFLRKATEDWVSSGPRGQVDLRRELHRHEVPAD